MKRTMLAGICALAMAELFALPAAASEETIIAVSGSAVRTVAADELSISFDLSTEGTSFSDAKNEADAVVERVNAELASIFADRVDVTSRVLVLRQKRFSWSSKSKKLDHRINVVVTDFEKDLPGQAITTLDRLLALDPRLELTDMEGRLSDAKAAQVRAELLTEAFQNAHDTASALAREAGQRLSMPKVINAAPKYSPSGYVTENVAVFARSFSVQSDLVGEVEISLELVAEFAASPVRGAS